MTKLITVQLAAFVALGILTLSGCKSEKSISMAPAEQFVLSRLPGELKNTFMSHDGVYFCGEVGTGGDERFRRFYANLKQRSIAYQGDHTFKLVEFASRCGAIVAREDLIADDAQL